MLDTQRESHEAILEKLPERRAAVARVIRGAGEKGATLFDIAFYLSWPINCVSGRVTELAKAGVIVDSGRRAVNPRSGRRAAIWIAAK